MEESSNGKVEEIQNVESQDADKEVVVEDSGEFKTEVESVKETVVNGNSESVNDGDDSSSHSSSSDEEAEPSEKSQLVDSGELLEKKKVIDSVIDSVQTQVSEELTEDVEVAIEILETPGDVAQSESKEIGGNISESMEEIIGVSSEETNVVSKAVEEETLPSADENDVVSPVLTEVTSKTIEEITLPSSEENVEVPPATTDIVSNAIEETKLPVLEQKTEEPSATATDLESKEKVDEPNQAIENKRTVDTSNPREYTNKPENVPESTGNPPIISLSQRTFQPTSWRSCCGLLEVFRRSDR